MGKVELSFSDNPSFLVDDEVIVDDVVSVAGIALDLVGVCHQHKLTRNCLPKCGDGYLNLVHVVGLPSCVVNFDSFNFSLGV